MTPARPSALIEHTLAAAKVALGRAPQTRDWTPDLRRRALQLLGDLERAQKPYRPTHLQQIDELQQLTVRLDPPEGTVVRSSLENLAMSLSEEVVNDRI